MKVQWQVSATRTQCPGPREWSWDSHLPADPVECRYHILAAVAVAHVQHGHVARVGVHDGQHAELLARHQLAMHEVHCLTSLSPTASTRSSRSFAFTRRFGVLFLRCMPNSL